MSYIDELGTAAKKAELVMTTVGTKQKNSALEAIAESLIRNKETIIKENKRAEKTPRSTECPKR